MTDPLNCPGVTFVLAECTYVTGDNATGGNDCLLRDAENRRTLALDDEGGNGRPHGRPADLESRGGEPIPGPTRDFYLRLMEHREGTRKMGVLEWDAEKRAALAAGADPLIVNSLGLTRPVSAAGREAERRLVLATIGAI